MKLELEKSDPLRSFLADHSTPPRTFSWEKRMTGNQRQKDWTKTKKEVVSNRGELSPSAIKNKMIYTGDTASA